MIKKINKIGNSRGIIIEKALLLALGIEDYVTLEIKNESIVIKKQKRSNNNESKQIRKQ